MSTTKKKQIKEEKKWYQKTKQDLKKTYRSARGRPGSAGDRELDHAKKLAIKNFFAVNTMRPNLLGD